MFHRPGRITERHEAASRRNRRAWHPRRNFIYRIRCRRNPCRRAASSGPAWPAFGDIGQYFRATTPFRSLYRPTTTRTKPGTNPEQTRNKPVPIQTNPNLSRDKPVARFGPNPFLNPEANPIPFRAAHLHPVRKPISFEPNPSMNPGKTVSIARQTRSGSSIRQKNCGPFRGPQFVLRRFATYSLRTVPNL